MKPYYTNGQTTLYHGDVLDVLRQLPDGTAQTCVTSPPYWGLRDYGVEGQIGLEETPDAYVARMVDVFREVRRVLRDDGTLWLNLGDSYSQGKIGRNDQDEESLRRRYEAFGTGRPKAGRMGNSGGARPLPPGLKPKDLVGIPWMVAFALRADGWYLRQDIIWAKPNPMPESVTDRPTKAHEYVFLLSKQSRYYYDADAVREPDAGRPAGNREGFREWQGGADFHARTGGVGSDGWVVGTGRNKRSVWTVASRPFPEAHFATFPPDLIKPCILAGSAPGDTVLDPFVGSGTTCMVAGGLGRASIGIDLNASFLDMTIKRSAQPGMPL